MNNNYNQPDLEIIKYSREDVLNTTGESHGIPLPDDEWPDEENNS